MAEAAVRMGAVIWIALKEIHKLAGAERGDCRTRQSDASASDALRAQDRGFQPENVGETMTTINTEQLLTSRAFTGKYRPLRYLRSGHALPVRITVRFSPV
jgi:hypothetical protein